jgi:hypothetical protein
MTEKHVYIDTGGSIEANTPAEIGTMFEEMSETLPRFVVCAEVFEEEEDGR